MEREFVGETIGDNPYYAGPAGVNFIKMSDDLKVRLSSANVLSLAKDAVEKIKKPYQKFSRELIEIKKKIENPVVEKTENPNDTRLERNKKALQDAIEKMSLFEKKQVKLNHLMEKTVQNNDEKATAELKEEYSKNSKIISRYNDLVLELKEEISKLEPQKQEVENKIEPPETPTYAVAYQKIESLMKNKEIQVNKLELTEQEKEKLTRDLNIIDDKIRMTEQVLIKESKLNKKILDHDLSEIINNLKEKRSKLVFTDNSNNDNIIRIVDINTKLAALEGFQVKQKNLYNQLIKSEELREKIKTAKTKEENNVEKEQINSYAKPQDSRIANASYDSFAAPSIEMSEADKVNQLINQRRTLLEKKDRLHDVDPISYSKVLREISLIEDNIPSLSKHESRLSRSQYTNDIDNQSSYQEHVIQGVEQMRKNMHDNIDRDMDDLVETLNKMFKKQMGDSKKF